jgi:hypothetical protein
MQRLNNFISLARQPENSKPSACVQKELSLIGLQKSIHLVTHPLYLYLRYLHFY